MRLSELFAGEAVEMSGGDPEIAALVSDSRRVTRQSLFAALPGARADGHEHIGAAVEKGAAAVLCERPVPTLKAARILASNSRLALAHAARRFYGDPAARLLMVGITGTNGKTTTVHLLESILAAAGQKPGIIGTLGTRYAGHEEETGLTTPDSISLVALLDRMASAGITAVAMEVSSHSLAQERVAGVSYDAAIFSNLTHDHLDYHGTLDAYFAAKARLFDERLKPNGAAALNLDDPRVRALAARLEPERLFGFTVDNPNDELARIKVEHLTLGPAGADLEVHTPAGTLRLHSPLVGRFNVANVMAAVAAAVGLGLPLEAIRRGAEALKAVPGRLERVSGNGAPLVLVDYSHTPDALAKALAAVREVTSGRLFCLFGCGGDRDPLKRPVMAQVANRGADWSVLTNDNPRSEEPQAIAAGIEQGFVTAGASRSREPRANSYWVELDRAAAIRLVVSAARPGDAVLLAGKGHETYQIVGAEKRPFDDRAHGRAALEAAGFSAEGTDE